MTHLRRLAPVAVLLAFVVFVAGCGDGGEPTGTTQAVTFGEGEIPASVPEDFPIPADAEIGSTLVDKINNKTEFSLTLRSDRESAIQFFQVGLVNQGYVVVSSDGNQTLWELSFRKGEALTGSITLSTPQLDLVAVVVSLSTS
jgi:hypothetical protein